MAKKPPQNPPSPFEDFDPERELNDEIVPFGDDLFVDDAEGTTRLDLSADDDILPPVEEVVDDEIVVGVEDDDMLVDVDAVEPEAVSEPVDVDSLLLDGDNDVDVVVDVEPEPALTEPANVDDLLLDGEIDVDVNVAAEGVLDDDVADKALVDVEGPIDAGDDAVVDDDIVDPDTVAVEDDDLSPHESETVGSMPALDDDDPFAGVGGDLDETPAEGEEGELVGAGVGEGGDDQPYVEEEIPVPKTHWFTWALIGLNIVAALTAPYLIVLTLQKRQEFTYAVFRRDLAMLGLPTVEEERAMTAARGTLPGYRISPEEIKRIVAERIGPQKDRIVGFEEQIIRRVPPSMLTKEILKDHFDKLYIESPEPITTVEAEIKRIEKLLVPDIKKIAKESLEKVPNDEAKRTRITRMLHPLAMDVHQSEALDKQIKDAKGAELDKLYIEAAERRMAFDFLLPLELFRPGDSKTLFVEKIGDLKQLPLDKVLERVNERLLSTIDKNYQPAVHLGDEYGKLERGTIEKRLTVAFTLLTLAHLKNPDGELLYPDLLERIPLVMGQYDFSLACELFPSRLMRMNERVLEKIDIDRRGFEVADKDGALIRNKAFIDYYEDELQRIRFIQQDIFKAKIRLADLEKQKARYETLLAERTKQRADVLAKIAVARAKTAKDVAELRRFQDDLFRYQIELATSEEDLARVNREIEEKLGKRGAKQP